MPFRVFISYSTKDLAIVKQARRMLAHPDVDVFVAEYSVAPGQPLSTTIKSAIQNCDLFILFWSRNAQASEWVPQEIGIATAAEKRIIPIVLDRDLSLPGFIKELKYFAAHENPQKALLWLRKGIVDKTEKTSSGIGLVVLLGLAALFMWLLMRESDE